MAANASQYGLTKYASAMLSRIAMAGEGDDDTFDGHGAIHAQRAGGARIRAATYQVCSFASAAASCSGFKPVRSVWFSAGRVACHASVSRMVVSSYGT